MDTLFRSASESARERVTGVVLSGMRDDGAAGLGVIKSNGGIAFVQAPLDALHPGMPCSALDLVHVDGILRCEDLGPAISAAALGATAPEPARNRAEIEGKQLPLVCPECGGVLTERVESGVPRWECHVGHLYSPDSLDLAQSTGVERALWAALRMLRDRAALLRRLADQAAARGHAGTTEKFRVRAVEADEQADAVLAVLRDSAEMALEATDSGGENGG